MQQSCLQQYTDALHGELDQGWRLDEGLDLDDVVLI